MNEDDVGKVFLWALPWDWTLVGRFAGYVGDKMLLEEAGYFTRTGATFDKLCRTGFTAETQFHPMGRMRVRADFNILREWEADWPQVAGRRR
jgi:hypothetical protein